MGYFNGRNIPEGGFTIEHLQAEADRISETLRALIAEFTDEEDNEPITSGDRKVASRTPDDYLKTGAEICAAAPDLHELPPRAFDILDRTYAGQLIFAPVLELAVELASRIEQGMVRKKLTALPVAQLVHRIARLIVETGAGKWLTAYVEHMKAILARPSRKKKEGVSAKKIRDAEDSSRFVSIPQPPAKEDSASERRTGHERTSPSPSAPDAPSRTARGRASDGHD
jgi:hypothetical protein